MSSHRILTAGTAGVITQDIHCKHCRCHHTGYSLLALQVSSHRILTAGKYAGVYPYFDSLQNVALGLGVVCVLLVPDDDGFADHLHRVDAARVLPAYLADLTEDSYRRDKQVRA